MKKEYKKPAVEEMSIKETATVKCKPRVDYQCFWWWKRPECPVSVEEYYPASGEEE